MYSNVASDKTLFTPVNLNTVLEEILEDLEDVISSKNVQLQRDHLPVVEAIPIQMRQLFQNLLSNAIKYSKPGYPPIIHINCLDSEDEYRITVKDNGIGFNNEYAEKIFHVFQRLLNNRSYEGTGIGLALCKKIVEAHNGRIYAESEEGKGSIFFIHLPKVHQPNIIQQP
jgi:light-regulated signal transduction histidine kinase (bacteriophytochrome)